VTGALIEHWRVSVAPLGSLHATHDTCSLTLGGAAWRPGSGERLDAQPWRTIWPDADAAITDSNFNVGRIGRAIPRTAYHRCDICLATLREGLCISEGQVTWYGACVVAWAAFSLAAR